MSRASDGGNKKMTFGQAICHGGNRGFSPCRCCERADKNLECCVGRRDVATLVPRASSAEEAGRGVDKIIHGQQHDTKIYVIK